MVTKKSKESYRANRGKETDSQVDIFRLREEHRQGEIKKEIVTKKIRAIEDREFSCALVNNIGEVQIISA